MANESDCVSTPNMVWDSLDERCISANPCKNADYDEYCEHIFKTVQLESVDDAKKLVDLYLSKKGLICEEFEAGDSAMFGQDYIRCRLSNGEYREFEFDDYSDSGNRGSEGYATGVCLIYGGNPGLYTSEIAGANKMVDVDILLVCENVSAEECDEMYSGYAKYSEEGNRCFVKSDFEY
jgi:hypothetical protein